MSGSMILKCWPALLPAFKTRMPAAVGQEKEGQGFKMHCLTPAVLMCALPGPGCVFRASHLQVPEHTGAHDGHEIGD